MGSIQHWISAFRLRTLFLAVATVVLGSGLAWHKKQFSLTSFLLILTLAVSIQILSNLANDLGDYQKGTDTTGKRLGPSRAMQAGKISAKQIKRAIVLFTILSTSVGLTLVLNVAHIIGWQSVVIMLVIGLLCILSALCYTIGKYAYGYHGWGDFFAFLFFGPVPVIGTYFLQVHALNFRPVLPAIGLGLISVMVLNINNMRDIENDKSSEKITIAARLGLKNAKFYHTLLTFFMFACFIAYNYLYAPSPWYRYMYALVFLFQFKILIAICTRKEEALDPYLKFTALSGFILSVIFVFCINI